MSPSLYEKSYHSMTSFDVQVNGDAATAWSRWTWIVVGADGMSRALGVPSFIADVIVAISLLTMLISLMLTTYRVRVRNGNVEVEPTPFVLFCKRVLHPVREETYARAGIPITGV